MPAPVLFRNRRSLDHDPGPHPESPQRIVAIERELGGRDWLGYDVRDSPAASRAQLEAVHDAGHIDRIEQLCARGGGAIDGDTFVSAGSFAAALHAAGGAVALVDMLVGDGVGAGASMHRPPGHHATVDRAMGFCLFNNIAIAARHARDGHGVGRVLIVDWDVHHGNGTNDIFHATDEVLFCSIHQWPLYPGTGSAADVGSGPGRDHTVNLPVPAGSGDDAWCSLVAHVAAPLARRYQPGLVLVSAGYDAHADDPLASCRVSDAGYATMAASVAAVAGELDVPVGVVLEGGYDVAALARSFAATLEVMGASDPPVAPELPVHRLAAEARERHGL